MSIEDSILANLAKASAGDTEETLPAEELGAEEETDNLEEVEGEESDGEDSEEGDEAPEEEESEKLFEVKLPGGEVVKVDEKELTEGYLRRNDYTRKMQELKNVPNESELEALRSQAQLATDLNDRFDTDPVTLVGDLITTAGKQDPQSVTDVWFQLTTHLIGEDRLTDQVIELFGFNESQVAGIKSQSQSRVTASERERQLLAQQRQLAPLQVQQEEQEYISQFDTKFGEFASRVGATGDEYDALRLATIKFMTDNDMEEIGDIKRAAALVRSEREVERKLAELNAKPKQKRKPSAVSKPTRQGSPAPKAAATSLSDEDAILARLTKFSQ